MSRLSFSNILWLVAHNIIIVESQQGMPGMGGVMPGMGGGMTGMGGGMPGMGGGMPGMGGGMPGMGGGGKQPTAAQIQQMKEQQEKMKQGSARILLSTFSQDGIMEEQVMFATGHVASPQWGWLTEIPSDGKGHGCSPLTTKHKEGQLIALIKRGGCSFADKATNGGTKMSIIYDNKDGKQLVLMSGFEKRKDITAAFANMSTGNKISQKLKESKCLLAQIRPDTDKTPWKKVSELSPCPFWETEPSTPQTTSIFSTEGSATTRNVTGGKPMDNKHIKKGGPDETNKESKPSHRDGTSSMNKTNKINKESIPSQHDETSSMNKTNKRVAHQKLDKPGVTEKEHVTEPNIRSTTIKGENKALAEKLVNTTDPSEVKHSGEMENVIGGTSGIILANSVMLFMTMHFIN